MTTPPPPPAAVRYPHHVIRAVRFPFGLWIAGCSCAEYMSQAYRSHDEAVGKGRREHQIMLAQRAQRRAA